MKPSEAHADRPWRVEDILVQSQILPAKSTEGLPLREEAGLCRCRAEEGLQHRKDSVLGRFLHPSLAGTSTGELLDSLAPCASHSQLGKMLQYCERQDSIPSV